MVQIGCVTNLKRYRLQIRLPEVEDYTFPGPLVPTSGARKLLQLPFSCSEGGCLSHPCMNLACKAYVLSGISFSCLALEANWLKPNQVMPNGVL